MLQTRGILFSTLLAGLLLTRGESAPLQFTDHANEISPRKRAELLQRAAALIAQNDLATAEKSLQKLLASDTQDAVALNLYGVIRMQQGNFDGAERLFRQAIQTGHRIVGPHLNLARLYAAGRPLDAIAELKEALAIAPEDREAKALLQQIAKKTALTAMRSGNKERAMMILSAAREILPRDAEILYETGFVALDCELYQDAEHSLQQALEIRPGYADAKYALARTYLAENLAGPAEEEMRKYLADRPDDATALYGLGYILLAEQRIDDAKAFFQKSLAAQPNQTESLFQLGEIALQKGQDASAEDDFRRVLVRDPGHGGAWTEIGVLAFRASHYEEAKSDLELAIEGAPSYQKAHYYYALTLSKLGRKTEAEREFETAKSLQKEHGAELHLAGAQP